MKTLNRAAIRSGSNDDARGNHLDKLMSARLVFDADLIRRYNPSGPRYTSYPTVAQFHTRITEDDYRKWVRHSNEDPIPRPLSLYFHIPFCDTVCFYCACTKVVTKNHDRATDYLDHLCK